MVETVSASTLPQGSGNGSAARTLEPGTEIKARVESNLPGGVVRLATADGKVDLRVASPLPANAEVTVTVSGSKQQPAILITTDKAPAQTGQQSGGAVQGQGDSRPSPIRPVPAHLRPPDLRPPHLWPTPLQRIRSGRTCPKRVDLRPHSPLRAPLPVRLSRRRPRELISFKSCRRLWEARARVLLRAPWPRLQGRSRRPAREAALPRRPCPARPQCREPRNRPSPAFRNPACPLRLHPLAAAVLRHRPLPPVRRLLRCPLRRDSSRVAEPSLAQRWGRAHLPGRSPSSPPTHRQGSRRRLRYPAIPQRVCRLARGLVSIVCDRLHHWTRWNRSRGNAGTGLGDTCRPGCRHAVAGDRAAGRGQAASASSAQTGAPAGQGSPVAPAAGQPSGEQAVPGTRLGQQGAPAQFRPGTGSPQPQPAAQTASGQATASGPGQAGPHPSGQATPSLAGTTPGVASTPAAQSAVLTATPRPAHKPAHRGLRWRP